MGVKVLSDMIQIFGELKRSKHHVVEQNYGGDRDYWGIVDQLRQRVRPPQTPEELASAARKRSDNRLSTQIKLIF